MLFHSSSARFPACRSSPNFGLYRFPKFQVLAELSFCESFEPNLLILNLVRWKKNLNHEVMKSFEQIVHRSVFDRKSLHPRQTCAPQICTSESLIKAHNRDHKSHNYRASKTQISVISYSLIDGTRFSLTGPATNRTFYTAVVMHPA